MIYYFSGTGNSRWVAEKLAAATNDRICEMLSASGQSDSPSAGEGKDETIGLVFPVYAWGLPRVVEQFVREKLPTQMPDTAYIYCVMTCGDDMGYTDRILSRLLARHCQHTLDAVFSVHMPNTYVCLPGFDIDSDELAKKKVSETQAALPHIVETITMKARAVEVCRGALPWTKSYILRALFNKVLVTDKYFRCDTSLCTNCKSCIQHCPLGNISLDTSTTPPHGIQWHHNCTGCLGCYHVCPHHAINFGNQTQKKGQKKHIQDETL